MTPDASLVKGSRSHKPSESSPATEANPVVDARNSQGILKVTKSAVVVKGPDSQKAPSSTPTRSFLTILDKWIDKISLGKKDPESCEKK